uniref:Helix-turn-helix transcriptional regulator n=1 Tax=Phenylobacterium glaciei TaxID=2803784 RepID=A0A974P6R1_9CAUL|nr:helix-turn-helix transcriptional regulator [Phenylobacterium glaciei]
MHERFGTVTEREKETLRLLLNGHDAKSIAVALGLSVHTVNERLREARRKLGVSSSREAARLLAQVDGPGPNILGTNKLGSPRHLGRAMSMICPKNRDARFAPSRGSWEVQSCSQCWRRL